MQTRSMNQKKTSSRRPKKVGQRPKQRMLPGFEELLNASTTNDEARDALKAALRVNSSPDGWRGLVAVPPGTFLDTMLNAFRSCTDIPLEIPWFAVMSMISAMLLRAGSTIKFAQQMVSPALWTVVLADSGAGKTWTTNTVLKATGCDDYQFPDPASSAQFVASLATHNRSLWVRDEFGQFLKSMDQQTHMAELRDYLLRLYDGKKIERNTKKEQICIKDPALVIFGTTVTETFHKCVPPEAILDGFAQRFGYIIASPDHSRTTPMFPWYDLDAWIDQFDIDWKSIVQTNIHQTYIVDAEGKAAFEQAFVSLYNRNQGIPASYFRRAMFSAVRYALIYHVLQGDTSNVLTPQDFSWAARVVHLHMVDGKRLLDNYGLSELERAVSRVESLKQEAAARGEELTPREIIRRVNAIHTVQQAKAILDLLK